MPRMIKLPDSNPETWINVDQVISVERLRSGNGTRIDMPRQTIGTAMPVDDVLRLIDPPSMPDHFEAIMGRMKDRQAEGLEDRPMTAGPEAEQGPTSPVDDGLDAVSIARLEELATIADLLARMPDEGRTVKHVLLHIAQRIMAIQQQSGV